MQFITIISLLFAASAIAAPIAQIDPSGINEYGPDSVPSKTNGNGDIVRVSDGALTANGKL